MPQSTTDTEPGRPSTSSESVALWEAINELTLRDGRLHDQVRAVDDSLRQLEVLLGTWLQAVAALLQARTGHERA